MDEHSKRLGSELQASREARRPRLAQPEAAQALGVSRTTIQNIEYGIFKRVNPTVRAYAALLGWPDGAADHVWSGGALSEYTASAVESTPKQEGQVNNLGLSPAVEYELKSGDVLDSQVINLGPDEDDGHIIVVLQGRKGATPEQVERIVAKYGKARRHLQGIGTEADEVAES